MARVVQRRSAPPYLLILFVFLFLIATTLAVLFYMQADKEAKALAKAQEENKLLINQTQNNSSEIRARKEESRKNRELTVVGILQDQLGKLANYITGGGTQTPFQDADVLARAAQEAMRAGSGEVMGLAPKVEAALKENKTLEQDKKNLQKKLEERQNTIDALGKENAKLVDDHTAELQRASQRTIEVGQRLKDREKKHAQNVRTLEDAHRKAIEEQQKNQTILADEVDQLRKQYANKADEAEHWKRVAGERSGRKTVAGPEADGRIVRVLADQKICYIDIGQKQRLAEGITFAVYPSSGIPKQAKEDDKAPKGKANIEVMRTYANTAECRILQQDPLNPIVVGDLIVNEAFAKTRTMTFVVEGYFDLRGTGTATAVGAEEIKALIRRFGGKVADNPNFQTDYLVLGKRPDLPKKPTEDDPPQVWEVYRNQLKAIKRYQDVRVLATSLSVPILNTNRFLAFTGQLLVLAK